MIVRLLWQILFIGNPFHSELNELHLLIMFYNKP